MTSPLSTHLILQRKKDTLIQYGLGRSTFHARINEGLIPPPVSLLGRAVAWPAHETQQVIAAMVAGKTKDEIKTLILALVDERQNLLERV